jgi:ArsR family metal-binding transcriptional regulator
MDDKYINTFELRVFTPPCKPGAERLVATASLVVDIRDVLPYLNATLRGAVYHKAANSLTWKKGGHNIVFNAIEISSSNVEDRPAAEKEIQGLVKMVNCTWDRRSEITPSYESRQRPAPMAVYKLLPQTNCKGCGEATCWIFALKLATSQKKLADCLPLSEAQYTDRLAALDEIVIGAPAIR